LSHRGLDVRRAEPGRSDGDDRTVVVALGKGERRAALAGAVAGPVRGRGHQARAVAYGSSATGRLVGSAVAAGLAACGRTRLRVAGRAGHAGCGAGMPGLSVRDAAWNLWRHAVVRFRARVADGRAVRAAQPDRGAAGVVAGLVGTGRG